MALSADTARKRKHLPLARHESHAAGTSATIYVGSLVALNTSTGRAVAASAAASRRFLGVSEQQVTGNTGGTVNVKYLYGHAEYMDAATALTKAYIGRCCVVSDDDKVTTASAAGTAGVQVRVGEVLSIPTANKAWVWIRGGNMAQTV